MVAPVCWMVWEGKICLRSTWEGFSGMAEGRTMGKETIVIWDERDFVITTDVG